MLIIKENKFTHHLEKILSNYRNLNLMKNMSVISWEKSMNKNMYGQSPMVIEIW